MRAVPPWGHRKDVAALPATLATLGAYAHIRGSADVGEALVRAATAIDPLAPHERVRLVRRLREHDADVPAPLVPEAANAIRRIIRSGSEVVLAAEAARLPQDLARLLAVPGVTAAEVLYLHRRFGVVTAADLAAAATLAGQSATDHEDLALHQRLIELLPNLRAGHPRIPLGRAWAIAQDVQHLVASASGAETVLTPVGSLRRFEPTVGDIELLAQSASPNDAIGAIVRAVAPVQIMHRGARLATFTVRDEQVTVRAVPPAEYPFALLYYTGSAVHVRQLQARAADRGWQLSPAALVAADSPQSVACDGEAAIYARLGLQFVPPERRHGEDEIDAAARQALAAPIRVEDVRGDLHVHTLWSDGRDSVEAVAWAARALGYEYVALTDHSPNAPASRVMTLDRLEQRREDIERARARVPGIRILEGAEVDILPDGTLDLPDAALERLDVVLASLHDAAGQSPDQLLERYVAAMQHPLVHIVTHPANRLVGRHEGYLLDYDELFAAAARTGTALEIDGAPAHLDLDGHVARRAAEAGAMLSVNSDCHNVARLGRQMLFAVGTARRGGIEARHVLNSRRLDDLLGILQAKRRRA